MNLYALKTDFEEISRFVIDEPDRLNGYMPWVFSLTNVEILNSIIKSQESGERIISVLNGDQPFVSAYGEEASRFLIGFLREFIDEFFRGEFKGSFDNVFEAVWVKFERDITGDYYLYTELAPVLLTQGNEAKLELPGPVFLYKWGSEELKGVIPPDVNLRIVDGLISVGVQIPIYVLLTRERVKKAPDNLLKNAPPGLVLSDRISAVFDVMRLYAKGDIHLGPVYGFREPQHAYISFLGPYSIQRHEWFSRFGENFDVDTIDVIAFREIYDDLEIFKRFKSWPNIRLALRRFEVSYSPRFRNEDDLIDLVIALEALLVTGKEQVAHKLASNAAVLLACAVADKLVIYRKLKKYYDIRSKLVHGGDIKKYGEYLRGLPDLKGITRRLLLGFIKSAVTEGDSWYKTLHDRLDSLVVDDDLLSRIKKNFT